MESSCSTDFWASGLAPAEIRGKHSANHRFPLSAFPYQKRFELLRFLHAFLGQVHDFHWKTLGYGYVFASYWECVILL